jgi:hypothetical protein
MEKTCHRQTRFQQREQRNNDPDNNRGKLILEKVRKFYKKSPPKKNGFL